jgi:hypothetical protein
MALGPPLLGFDRELEIITSIKNGLQGLMKLKG